LTDVASNLGVVVTIAGFVINLIAISVSIAFFAAKVQASQRLTSELLSQKIESLYENDSKLEARLGSVERELGHIREEFAAQRGRPLPIREEGP